MEQKNPPRCEDYFNNCLYFTTSTLSRLITKMADECFKPTGLAPSSAFLVMLVNESPGILQGQLAQKLNLAPSTITRFTDQLLLKGLITRESKGRNIKVFPTDKSYAIDQVLKKCWHDLYELYCKILGEELAITFTQNMVRINNVLLDKKSI